MTNRHYPPTRTHIPPIELLCGSSASFDVSSEYAHRCDNCGAVVGSVGMPSRCKELYDMEEVVARLNGRKDI